MKSAEELAREIRAELPNNDPQESVLHLVRELVKDAKLGRLVRAKMVSGNNVPVERCTITANEIAATVRGG